MNTLVTQEEKSRVEALAGPQPRKWWDWNLWLQWALANVVGEVLGLGLAGVIAIVMVLTIGEPETALVAMMMAGVMIAAGTLEGVIVGFAQWLVLRRRLHRLSRVEWVRATAIGAFLAWTIGMGPSTLMALNQGAGSPPPPEISDAVKYALASVMGVALGMILGVPQWRALRRYASGASMWVWANAAAWAVGMPVVFVGAGLSPVGASALSVALTVVVTIAAAGASVGAIHGVALLWLLRQRQEEASPANLNNPPASPTGASVLNGLRSPARSAGHSWLIRAN
jgi:hypothetical protein